MKTQIISILSGMILALSIVSVQATEIADVNVQSEALPQEIADIFLAEVEVDGISLIADQEMAESFGSRNCSRGRCCQGRGRR